MGGLAGRADAMFGAVECQKSNGSLHYHFLLFVQRLHQYCTFKEIAEVLEKAVVDASELKDFIANLCCTSYNDPEGHKKDCIISNLPFALSMKRIALVLPSSKS